MSNFETKLDDIMEDLIIGHNFNYARKAILEAHNKAIKDIIDKGEVLDD